MFFPNRIPFLIPLGTDAEDENDENDGNDENDSNDSNGDDSDAQNDVDGTSYDYGEYSTSLELNRTESGATEPATNSEQIQGIIKICFSIERLNPNQVNRLVAYEIKKLY